MWVCECDWPKIFTPLLNWAWCSCWVFQCNRPKTFSSLLTWVETKMYMWVTHYKGSKKKQECLCQSLNATGPRSSVPNGTAATPTVAAPPAAEGRSQNAGRMPRSTSQSSNPSMNAASRSPAPVPPTSTALGPAAAPTVPAGSPAAPPQNGRDPDEGGELGENTVWYLVISLASSLLVALLSACLWSMERLLHLAFWSVGYCILFVTVGIHFCFLIIRTLIAS